MVGAGGWRRFAHSMLKTRHAITMRKTVLNGDMRAKERTLKPTSQLTGKRHMPVSCPLSGTTPSLEELETDLTLSPLSRGPEPWGWTGRCPGIPVPSLTLLGSSLSHSFQLSLQALISQWFLRNLSALPQLHNVHALHFCHQQHLGEKIWSEPLES